MLVETQIFTIPNLLKTGLPPLPGSVMRISSMLSDMRVSQRQIAEAISIDPVLSSRVLRLANSPIYALRGEVTNLAMAVSAIGNKAIGETISISGVSDAFGRRVLSSPEGKEIWGHSLATAMAASEICRMARLGSMDEAFSCGLLHDIGKLILLRADMPLYKYVLERVAYGEILSEVEMEVYGFDHAELGAAAAESWKLPETVCSLIRYHHQPFDATRGLTLTYALHTADRLINLKTAERETEELLNEKTVVSFGLDVEQFDLIWNTVLVKLREILAAMN